jgi:sortase A
VRTRILDGACYFFLATGILALGYAGFGFADSHLYQAVAIRKFEDAVRPPQPRSLAEGDMLGEIQVPRLRLNAIVVQGDSSASLRRAVGHLSKSALPGEWGNVALAGHRDTFFRPLSDIRLGDEIRFKTRERSFEYRVESIEVVAPTEVRVLKSLTGHDLTLLTCYPIRYLGPAPKRLVVRAREVDRMLQEQLAQQQGRAPGGQSALEGSFKAGTAQ